MPNLCVHGLPQCYPCETVIAQSRMPTREQLVEVLRLANLLHKPVRRPKTQYEALDMIRVFNIALRVTHRDAADLYYANPRHTG
ncbi:hypothetical protein LCGC14_0397560 [marine sediment metagenome]|uniref:Uncharacterized protein n=1 Tax=marine sediment metagenome TaxID=412755 RepID=A0A0F9TG16_9ZZZZ